jgi:hypothetical protein
MSNNKFEGTYVITCNSTYNPVEFISTIADSTNTLVRTIVDIDIKDKKFDRYVVLTISNKYKESIKITCDDNTPVSISPNSYRIFKRVTWTPECWNYSPEIKITNY